MKSDNSLKVSYSKVLQTSMNVSVSSSGANMDYHQSQHHNHHQSATTTPKTSRQITSSSQGRRSQTNQNLNTYNRQNKVIINFFRVETNYNH
jgi:hypothetical protein